MKSPQVINLLEDSVMAFDGANVIDNTTQLPIDSFGFMLIKLQLIDLMTGTDISFDAPIVYHSLSKHWTLDLADLTTVLTDRHKYIGSVVDNDPGTQNMRTFQLSEFAIDNDSFEQAWMRLPYQIEIGGGETWMYWYDDIANFGNPANRKFKAQSYMGGSGTTYATSPDKVTHRGPIVEV